MGNDTRNIKKLACISISSYSFYSNAITPANQSKNVIMKRPAL